MVYAIFFLSLLAVPVSLCTAIWVPDLRTFLIFGVAVLNAAFWVVVMGRVGEKMK